MIPIRKGMRLRATRDINYQRTYPAIRKGEIGVTFEYSYTSIPWVGIKIPGENGPVEGGFGIGRKGMDLQDHWELLS